MAEVTSGRGVQVPSLRFSLGKQNTAGDVDFAIKLVPASVERLRELSPLYNKNEAVSS